MLQALDRYQGRASLVGGHPFFPADLSPCNQTLEDNWETIRAELDRLLQHREQLGR
jgi:beta-hydroxylase